MSKPNYEKWIWTELLAFDNSQVDQGVQAYLDRLGFVPQGISLLVSAADFFVLHEAMDKERRLFPDACSRCGHAGNEERSRQDWTNYQLRLLVQNLQAKKIEVFCSVFMYYLKDKFHHEWATDHPEILLTYEGLGVTDGLFPLARLDDGTLYEDIFIHKMLEVVQDYGFDGWHGPDAQGPSGALSSGECSDSFMRQFAEYLGDRLPVDFELVSDGSLPSLRKRMDYIWNNLWREWTEFNMSRWESFWGKAVNGLRAIGKKSMINSGNTKSAFESIYIYGIDYRKIAEIGVDYLVVETVAGNLALIEGHDCHFDFAATLAEMKAFVPGMKVIFLHGIKDVVESYDLLRHAPGRLDREVYTLTNQYYVEADQSLSRCADGLMACLGDGLQAAEWEYLRRQWQVGYGLDTVRVGGLTWVFDDVSVDALRDDYPLNGTWPGFKQVGYLVEHYDLQINQICRPENVDEHKQPLLVPNFDLCSKETQRQLLSYDAAPVVLLGKMDGLQIPESAGRIECEIAEGYTIECVILNGGMNGQIVTAVCDGGQEFICDKPPYRFEEMPKYMVIPAGFWDQAVDSIGQCVDRWEKSQGLMSCRARNVEEGLRIITMEDAEERMRVAFISCAPKYICPEYGFSQKVTGVEKVSSFPYTSVAISNDVIVTGHRQSVLHIPPYGVITVDVEFDHAPY